MKKKIVLISKDAFGIMNLPHYGNLYWKTPNIDRLVASGTLFEKHYTTAPSTGMAFTSMFTGKYPYELPNRRVYKPVDRYNGETLFDKFKSIGYSCHIIWDDCFNSYALPFANCFGEDSGTVIHSLNIREPVGGHKKNDNVIVRNDDKTKKAMELLVEEISNISLSQEKLFLWVHLPHVIAGRTGYGSDVDTVDELVGWFLDHWGDDCIFLTGDHGHMNLTKSRIGYGWDVEESAIRVPLITPRIQSCSSIDYVTSHVDLSEIIFHRTIRKRDFIVVDTAYYAQPRRKTAIISGQYKYIYDKTHNQDFLYDLLYDKNENHNLLINQKYDPDRHRIIYLSEVVFYPFLERVEEVYVRLRSIKDSFWKKGKKSEEIKARIKTRLLSVKLHFYKFLQEKRLVKSKKRYEK